MCVIPRGIVFSCYRCIVLARVGLAEIAELDHFWAPNQSESLRRDIDSALVVKVDGCLEARRNILYTKALSVMGSSSVRSY